MDISVIAFLVLLSAVAVLRLVEVRISRKHQREMIARGASKVDDPKFRWMVLLHLGVLLGAALEVIFLKRPFIPALAAVMFAIFLAANAVRWWVIRTLGKHWNVQVMDSTRLGVVSAGPFLLRPASQLCCAVFLRRCWRCRFDPHGMDHRDRWSGRPHHRSDPTACHRRARAFGKCGIPRGNGR